MAERCCWQFEQGLRSDFRAVAFLRPGLDPSRLQITEERLRALPDVAQVQYVSPQQALAHLRREDPEVFESVALLGENPLPPAYEVALGPEAIRSFSDWLARAYAVTEVVEVRYRAAQARAVVQSGLWARYLTLAINCIICLVSVLTLAALWLGRPDGGAGRRAAVGAAVGGLAGMAAAFAAAWPLEGAFPFWGWPEPGRCVTWLGAAAAWLWALERARERAPQ